MSRVSTLVLVLFASASLSAQTPHTLPVTPTSPIQTPAPAPAEGKPLADSVHVVIKKRYPAIYSLEAEEKKLHGTVVLTVLFNEAGAEENSEVTSGDPILAQCAAALVGKWRIEPFIRGGKPVKVKVPIPFEFVDDTPSVSFSTGEVSVNSTGAAVERVTLSSRVTKGMLVKKVQPEYPPTAKAAHIEGSCIFAAVIGKDGTIRELYALSGDKSLTKAASDAVFQWRYKPYIYHGDPVSFEVRIQVNFHLAD